MMTLERQNCGVLGRKYRVVQLHWIAECITVSQKIRQKYANERVTSSCDVYHLSNWVWREMLQNNDLFVFSSSDDMPL